MQFGGPINVLKVFNIESTPLTSPVSGENAGAPTQASKKNRTPKTNTMNV